MSSNSNGKDVLQDETPFTVTVISRSSRIAARSNSPVTLDLEVMRSRFHLRRSDAAADLGISETTLKQVCRKLGISRWPSRVTGYETNLHNPRGVGSVAFSGSPLPKGSATKRSIGVSYPSNTSSKANKTAYGIEFPSASNCVSTEPSRTLSSKLSSTEPSGTEHLSPQSVIQDIKQKTGFPPLRGRF